MAKYTINHTCGHNREIQLFGKNIERERKIEWLESQECPQCWGAKKREKDEKKPITATIQTNGLDTDVEGNVLAEIVLTGATKSIKEKIKLLGYHWDEIRGGVMDMLSMTKASQAWIKKIPLLQINKNNIAAELKQLEANIVININPLDIEMAKKNTQLKNKIDDEISKLEKPIKPKCLPINRGYWNGKIYGNEKYGYRVYIDNSEEKITVEKANEIIKYLIAKEKYNIEVNKIKERNNA